METTTTTPYIHFLMDIDTRLHNLRLKILDAGQKYLDNPTPENGNTLMVWATEKHRIEQKYGLKHE